MTNKFESLKNHYLMAMPSLMNPHFQYSVIYVLEHNEEGAMGLIINRPLSISVGDILHHMDIECPSSIATDLNKQATLCGGPMQPERGFVLHLKSDAEWQSSLNVSEQIQVTTSRDIIEALSQGTGPRDHILVLGYSAWEKGQLEREIAENHWLSIPANSVEILFSVPYAQRWRTVAKEIGINDVTQLSDDIGHA